MDIKLTKIEDTKSLTIRLKATDGLSGHFMRERYRVTYVSTSLAHSGLSRLKKGLTMLYGDYLKTEDWRRKRECKKKRAKNKCAICDSKEKRLDTHHINYKNLFDVSTSDLRLVCRECHYLIHELIKSGKIKFKPTDTTQKKYWKSRNAVRKFLGLDDKRHKEKQEKVRLKKQSNKLK